MPADEVNVARWLLAVGAEDTVALLYRDERLTCGQLRRQVDALAGALLLAGASKGDRVGLLSDNAPFFVISYLATVRAGLCSVPFPPGMDESSLRPMIEVAGIDRVLVQRKYMPFALKWDLGRKVELWPEASTTTSDGQRLTAASQRPTDTGLLDSVAIDPGEDLAVIWFTSGSTGRPKGVMVTHRNIASNTRDILSYMRLSPNDRVLAVLPLSYCFGASLLHTHLRAGASTVLSASFMLPEKVLDEMEAKACTGFAGVPSTYQILLRKTRFAQRRFPALRWLQQAGGKLPEPLIRELRQAHPKVKLFIMYGQTEATARLSYLPPEMLETKLGSIGRGLPSTRLEVVKDDGTLVAPGSDEVGEIVATGESVTKGYWNDPEETARYFRGGRLHTGDLARVDEQGFIYVVDRTRDFIKCAGNRVSAQEIEDVLADHPEVVHAAAVGTPDDLLGEAMTVYVVPRSAGSVSEQGIIDHCRQRLPNHKVPSRVLLVTRLPTNAYGKVLKTLLREGYWRGE